MFLQLAIKSLLNRKGSALLTLMALTVSIFVLLGVEHIRNQAKQSFTNTVSGVDLIVGARTGSLNLLLYSVFHIGAPTNNITWDSFEKWSNHPEVKWAVPISLGDSHKGYRVVGTTKPFFEYFSYGNKHPLSFGDGAAFEGMFDVVIGSEVARELNYQLGQKIVLAHGLAATSFSLHDDKPFTVVGILSPTGTPVDQTLHVSLQGIEAIHLNWGKGVKNIESVSEKSLELQPKNITAFMLGLESRMSTFTLQNEINNDPREPLMSILPGVALSELWQMMGLFESTLRFISFLVLVAALLGLSAVLLTSIRERSHEIHLLRVIGAPPWFLFLLIELEALIISLIGCILGALFLFLSLLMFEGLLTSHFGLHVSVNILNPGSLVQLGFIMVATLIAAGLPSLKAYSNSKRLNGDNSN